MFGQTSIASKRPILFYSALDFSPNCPHWAAKSALSKIKFAHFRLIMPAQTCSKTQNDHKFFFIFSEAMNSG